MNDYDKKIHRSEHDPYENISVNRIEKDKKGKEEFPKFSQEKPSKLPFFSTLIFCFKKLISLFGFKDSEQFLLLDKYQLFEHLAAFRLQLQTLSQRDESHNPEFTKQLTELWHNLTDDCNSLSISSEDSSTTISDIQFFISQISRYPYGTDHPLGYYFDAYAGRDWIPFPFMDILQELHQEHQKKPEDSHLTKWILLINNILSLRQDNF